MQGERRGGKGEGGWQHTFHERAIAEQLTPVHQRKMSSWMHKVYERRLAAPRRSTLNGGHEWVNKLHLQRVSEGRNGEMGE